MKDSKRTEVLERIKELEKKGLFHEEVEINPPTITLKPEDVDYLNKKWYHRLNTKLANQIAKNYIEKLIKMYLALFEKASCDECFKELSREEIDLSLIHI